MNLFALRKNHAPDVPKSLSANHSAAVAVDARGALSQDSFAPGSARNGIRKNAAGYGSRPKNIEVMDFAKEVLQFLEVVAPGFVLDGEKIFHDVAEAFDANAQAVKRSLGAVAKGAVVEFASFRPALEGQMLEECAAWPKARGPRGKRLAPGTPLFAVEFFESGLGFVLLLLFAAMEDFEQSVCGGPPGAARCSSELRSFVCSDRSNAGKSPASKRVSSGSNLSTHSIMIWTSRNAPSL